MRCTRFMHFHNNSFYSRRAFFCHEYAYACELCAAHRLFRSHASCIRTGFYFFHNIILVIGLVCCGFQLTQKNNKIFDDFCLRLRVELMKIITRSNVKLFAHINIMNWKITRCTRNESPANINPGLFWLSSSRTFCLLSRRASALVFVLRRTPRGVRACIRRTRLVRLLFLLHDHFLARCKSARRPITLMIARYACISSTSPAHLARLISSCRRKTLQPPIPAPAKTREPRGCDYNATRVDLIAGADAGIIRWTWI